MPLGKIAARASGGSMQAALPGDRGRYCSGGLWEQRRPAREHALPPRTVLPSNRDCTGLPCRDFGGAVRGTADGAAAAVRCTWLRDAAVTAPRGVREGGSAEVGGVPGA